MPKPNGFDEVQRRANEVRLIAAGIFDKGDRELVLRIVDDCEKRVDKKPAPSH
jgi:hypothetical protein